MVHIHKFDIYSGYVATSGNLSGEPVLTDNKQADKRFNLITDNFLQHNRPILRPADVTVMRIIDKKKRLFRIGRSFAPLELRLIGHSWHSGHEAQIIGEIREGNTHVILETELGRERFLEELKDDPLPRIC